MILQFPDAATLRLVLSGGLLPPETAALPARYAEKGSVLTVETDAKSSKKALQDLARLGVSAVTKHVGISSLVLCWHQILPLTRDPHPARLTTQTPVLFEIDQERDLATLVEEMLRLGNDRQSVRRVADKEGERIYLRVIGPPYYTLLRALDDASQGIRAYVEQAPRVWVTIGWTHPLADRLKVDEGAALLLRPPQRWVALDDAPGRDIYEILQFPIPAPRVAWEERKPVEKLVVPLRLAPSNALEVPELWLLREKAAETLDAFVKSADERLIQRLQFASAGTEEGNEMIVLRAAQAKSEPPVLEIPGAEGYKPYFKLPNLYLPVGMRLHPSLRRDAVRNLLADTPELLVWLRDLGQGKFVPESLPEEAFRPLEEWVDYVIDIHHVALAAWIDSCRFDFQSFSCEEGPKPPRSPDDDAKRKPSPTSEKKSPAPAPPVATPVSETKAAVVPKTFVEERRLEASALEKLRREAEGKFLDLQAPLDDPRRVAAWAELARLNYALRTPQEGALAAAAALWIHDAEELYALWFRAEFPELRDEEIPAEFERLLRGSDNSSGELRRLAVLVAFALGKERHRTRLIRQLPEVRQRLEKRESGLPVRVVWLLTLRMARAVGGDPLGIARTRDRLLQTLIDDGLRVERDLPHFFRSAGREDAESLRETRERYRELHRTAKRWIEEGLAQRVSGTARDHGATSGYIDLFFAFGYARLGERSDARDAVESAKKILFGIPPGEGRDRAARLLWRAYDYRITQSLEGKPHAGGLTSELLDAIDKLRNIASAGGVLKADGEGLALYAIDRLRAESRILEPHEKTEPYMEWKKYGDDVHKSLADLARAREPEVIVRGIRKLLSADGKGAIPAEARFAVVLEALPLATRVGEAFVVEMIELVPGTIASSRALESHFPGLRRKQGRLLERALVLAAHYDRAESVALLTEEFLKLLGSDSEEKRCELASDVVAHCAISLRKTGRRDRIETLLDKVESQLLAGRSLERLRPRLDKNAKTEPWTRMLQALLGVAAGRLAIGVTAKARPILDLAREELVGVSAPPRSAKEFTGLAKSYFAALGQGRPESVPARVAEVFRKTDSPRLATAFTTAPFFSRLHLELVEEAVLAIAGDDFTLGPEGRRRLEEEEYLVRQRIHRDARAAIATGR